MSNNRKGGPKTASGKIRSSRNARRHGLFSAAFSLSAAEQEEYKKLTSDFQEQLKPDNAFLDALFQDVVASFWNLRIAHGYEQQVLKKVFVIETEESDEKPHGATESFPYGLKAWPRAQVIKLLDYLRDEVEARRDLHPDLEQPVTQACGAYFWKALAEWAPVDPVQMIVSRLHEVGIANSKTFGHEMPGANISPEYERKYLAADGVKEKEMMCKLIDLYKTYCLLHADPSKGGCAMVPDDRVSRLDLAIRYLTTARRDFYRSLEEYWTAKNGR